MKMRSQGSMRSFCRPDGRAAFRACRSVGERGGLPQANSVQNCKTHNSFDFSGGIPKRFRKLRILRYNPFSGTGSSVHMMHGSTIIERVPGIEVSPNSMRRTHRSVFRAQVNKPWSTLSCSSSDLFNDLNGDDKWALSRLLWHCYSSLDG